MYRELSRTKGHMKMPHAHSRRLDDGDGMQTAALADCERLRANMRHAHLRQPKKRLQLIYCN